MRALTRPLGNVRSSLSGFRSPGGNLHALTSQHMTKPWLSSQIRLKSDVEKRVEHLKRRESLKQELRDAVNKTNMKGLLESCENPFSFESRMTRPLVADEFPPMILENVKGQKLDLNRLTQGKITLVGFFSNTHGGRLMEKWSEILSQHEEKHPEVELIQISYSPSFSTRIFKRFIISNIKKTLAEHRHSNYFTCFEKLDFGWLGTLGVENNLYMYTFLVDQNGRIRARSAGAPQSREGEFLANFIEELKYENELLLAAESESSTKTSGKTGKKNNNKRKSVFEKGTKP